MSITQILIVAVIFVVGVAPFWFVHSLAKRRQQSGEGARKRDGVDGSGADGGGASSCDSDCSSDGGGDGGGD